MTRPRLLDLFCGAGGAAMGYHRAGFDVVGVDIKPQPHYPFEFHQADVMVQFDDGIYEAGFGPFDAIHASPPCQRYIRGGLSDKAKHPDLIGPTRELLKRSGLPWAIENVPGAPIRADLVLCGSQWPHLKVRRHRWFEFSGSVLPAVTACDHSRPVVGVYGHPHGKAGAWRGMLPGTLATWSEAMGISWMTAAELALAVPPEYGERAGVALLELLTEVAA